MKRLLSLVTILLLVTQTVEGHEVRPAYLGIKQKNDSTYQVIWKIPAKGELTPRVYPIFPEQWNQELISSELLTNAARREWRMTTSEPLNGTTIVFKGLEKTIMDVLISIEFSNGELYSRVIPPDRPFYKIPSESNISGVIVTYLELGVEHILFGIDHLLFVMALVFITRGKWRIVKTITAFTLAHSITLSMAALGWVHIPVPPVEAVIALSIVFLAREILVHERGKVSLTYRKPWIVAFTFGLLHGFGFASALSETGLPQVHVPFALAFFNVGVEIGQLLFLLVIALLGLAWQQLRSVQLKKSLQQVAVYAIGSIASFWVIERVLGFF